MAPAYAGVAPDDPNMMIMEINGIKYFAQKQQDGSIIGLGPDGIMDWEELKRMAKEADK